MEFKRGNSESRPDRRICPKCERHCGTKPTCPKCGKETKPRIRIVWFAHGKRFRQLTNCWQEAEAQQVLRGIEADYWRQQRLGVSRDVGGTIERAVSAFEQSRANYSKNWQSQLRTALYPLRDGLGPDMDVTLVTRDDVQQYLDDGMEARSSSTMRSYMLVVRCFFNWLEEEGWIRVNPARRIKLPQATFRQADFLLPDQVGPVLDACWRLRPEFAPIATAMVLGSFRKGEVVNLRRQDIDLTKRWAFVLDFEGDELTEAWTTKTDSSRRAVPLHPLLVNTLRRMPVVKMPDGKPSPWMFPVMDERKTERRKDRKGRAQPVLGDRRSPDTTYFGRCLREALTEVGISHRVTVHGLRRTFAVLLQDVGAPDSVIRQAMGHAQVGVTERHYLPRRDAVVQRWVDRIRVDLKSAPYMPPLAVSEPERQPSELELKMPAVEFLQ